MVKQKVQGGKNNRRSKRGDDARGKRELLFKEDGQAYALIEKVCGSGRYQAIAMDDDVKKARLAILRGSLRKSTHPVQGDIVLLGLRDYQDAKADIIHKYTPDEVSKLKEYGELTHDVPDANADDALTVEFLNEDDESRFNIDSV